MGCGELHERGAKNCDIINVHKTNLYGGERINLKQVQIYNCERFRKSVACVNYYIQSNQPCSQRPKANKTENKETQTTVMNSERIFR